MIPEAAKVRDVSALRKNLVSWLREHEDKSIDPPGDPEAAQRSTIKTVPSVINGRLVTWETYLRRMAIAGEYCDERMVFAAALLFKRTIGVVSNMRPGQMHQIPEKHLRTGDDWNHELVVLGHYREYHWVASVASTPNLN